MGHGSPTNAFYLPVTDYRDNFSTIVASCILQALDFLCHASFQLGIYSQNKMRFFTVINKDKVIKKIKPVMLQ